MNRCSALLLAFGLGCSGASSSDIEEAPGKTPKPANNGPALLSDSGLSKQELGARDGADDGVPRAASAEVTALVAANGARFVDTPKPPGGHPIICDIAGFDGKVFVSTAAGPIDRDGALIFRNSDSGWELAFDWDRGGVPGKTHEVGGQGISRLRVIGDRMYAADSDAPQYGGFGITNAPFEDYLFVATRGRGFAELGPDDSPPPDTVVLPLAFHSFDVISFRGSLVATGGSVAIEDTSGTRYPGGLFVGKEADPVLVPRLFPGQGKQVGVVRTTYLQRYRGRLYVGFQNNSRTIRWDVGVLSGDPSTSKTADLVLARLTDDGGWLTRRFAVGDGRLYWVAMGYRSDKRGGAAFVSDDGLAFRRLTLPPGAGDPQDILVVGQTVLLLAQGGIYRAGRDLRFSLWAPPPPGNVFSRSDSFCSAPLTIAGNAIYAGSTRDGRVFRIEAK